MSVETTTVGPEHIDAAILAGGLGTRLRDALGGRPKALAEVAGRPFIEWQLLQLKAQGLRRVVLCTGYRSEQIEACLGDGARFGLELIYSVEQAPLGTGGALRQALEHLQTEHILVLNGDSYCRFDLDRLHDTHHARNARATLWLTPIEDTSRYGSVTLDAEARIVAFREKAVSIGAGLISAGVYLLERGALAEMAGGHACSLEKEFFPGLIGRGIYGVSGSGVFIDIGTPEAYQSAPIVLADELPQLTGGV